MDGSQRVLGADPTGSGRGHHHRRPERDSRRHTHRRPAGRQRDLAWPHGGKPATGENRHDRLLGDAVLSYDIDAARSTRFTGIINVDRNARTRHGRDVRRHPGRPGGAFAAGEAADRIPGGFYGPGHAETAGVFERSNIAGAFGA